MGVHCHSCMGTLSETGHTPATPIAVAFPFRAVSDGRHRLRPHVFHETFASETWLGECFPRQSRVGDQSPAFSVTALDGTPIRSSELRGHIVVLAFVATRCRYCKKELPHLQKIWEKLGNNSSFRILVIACGESAETVAAFWSTHNLSLPAAVDPDRSSCQLYANNGIPHVYVLSRDGRIAYQAIGFSEEEVERLNRTVQSELHRRNGVQAVCPGRPCRRGWGGRRNASHYRLPFWP